MILYHAFSKTFLPTYQCFLYLRASGSIYADERSFFSKSVEVVLMPKNSGFTTNRKERQIGVAKFIDISIHYLDFISTLHRRLIFKVASEKKMHSYFQLHLSNQNDLLLVVLIHFPNRNSNNSKSNVFDQFRQQLSQKNIITMFRRDLSINSISHLPDRVFSHLTNLKIL